LLGVVPMCAQPYDFGKNTHTIMPWIVREVNGMRYHDLLSLGVMLKAVAGRHCVPL